MCIINSFLIIAQYIFPSIKYHCLFIHPLNDWHVDNFHFEAIMNQLEVNAPIQVFFVKTQVLFSLANAEEWNFSAYSKCMFNFL